jgi:hypothetical protein
LPEGGGGPLPPPAFLEVLVKVDMTAPSETWAKGYPPAPLALSPGGRGRATQSVDRVRGSESPQIRSLLHHRPPHPPAFGGSPLPPGERANGSGRLPPLALLELTGKRAKYEQHAPASSPRRRGSSTPQRLWRMLMSSAATPRFTGSVGVHWIPAFAGITSGGGATPLPTGVHVGVFAKMGRAS